MSDLERGEKHQKLLKPYSCDKCDYKTEWMSGLKVHENAVHLKLKPYRCEQCDYRATQAAHLRSHTDSVHIKVKTKKIQL